SLAQDSRQFRRNFYHFSCQRQLKGNKSPNFSQGFSHRAKSSIRGIIHFVKQSSLSKCISLVWWFVFASAFAMTEAALVINVRRMLGWEPGLDYAEIFAARHMQLDSQAFTRFFKSEGLYVLELSREAATILLLVGAAMAAGKTWRERWGLFWLTFSTWDLAY